MMGNILKSNRGNAILMVLGLSVVVGIISVETYRRIGSTDTRARQSNLTDEADILMGSLRSRLDDPEACSELFHGAVLDPGNKSVVTLQRFVSGTWQSFVYDKTAAGPFREGGEVIRGVKLPYFRLAAEAGPDMSTTVTMIPGTGATPMFLRRFRVWLPIAFETIDVWNADPALRTVGGVRVNRMVKKKDASLTVADATKDNLDLSFLAWVNDANQIVSCHGVNSVAAFCNSIGGYYNPGSPDAAEANPRPDGDKRCIQSGTQRQLMMSDGGVYNSGSCRGGGMSYDGDCTRWGYNFTATMMQQAWGSPFAAPTWICLNCGE
jgi:hypothetical protein